MKRVVFGAILTSVLGAGCRSTEPEITVATAFLESVRLADTAMVRRLAEPESADDLVANLEHVRTDIRIPLALANPHPRVRRSDQLVTVVFPAPGADSGELQGRVTVALNGAHPPRVTGYILEPDIW